MSHGDPKNPQRNPHPVKRYEIIATVDAPGSWDSVSGAVFFEVANLACTPEDKFLGVHAKTRDVTIDFEMAKMDERTWKGYFYRDSMLDEDYYGLGVCHWDVTQASPVFSVHGENFVPGSGLENIKPLTRYFEKSEFMDDSRTGAAFDLPANNPKYVHSPKAFFPITVTVKEVTP